MTITRRIKAEKLQLGGGRITLSISLGAIPDEPGTEVCRILRLGGGAAGYLRTMQQFAGTQRIDLDELLRFALDASANGKPVRGRIRMIPNPAVRVTLTRMGRRALAIRHRRAA